MRWIAHQELLPLRQSSSVGPELQRDPDIVGYRSNPARPLDQQYISGWTQPPQLPQRIRGGTGLASKVLGLVKETWQVDIQLWRRKLGARSGRGLEKCFGTFVQNICFAKHLDILSFLVLSTSILLHLMCQNGISRYVLLYRNVSLPHLTLRLGRKLFSVKSNYIQYGAYSFSSYYCLY